MRQKSKQQAKIEATQKLEQVKNEQQQLQKQQQQQQFSATSVTDAPDSGNQSPTNTPTSSGGNSPMQALTPKDSFTRCQKPGTPTSSPSRHNVFLRPQLPPPSSTAKTPTHDAQCPLSQPQSPQMFSAESSSSRPSSPWDPYGKMVGTPRPPSGSSTPRRGSVSDGQERNWPSPAHESFGSPTSSSSDPYAKPPDTPRPLDPFVKPMGPSRPGPISEQQQGRIGNVTPGDNFSRAGQRSEAYQRMAHNRMVLSDPYSRPLLTPIPGSNESGSVPLFKTPMPPQSQQDSFSATQQGFRIVSSETFPQVQQSDPYAHQPLTPHPSLGDGFNNEGRMMRQTQGNPFAQALSMSRQRDPYAQAPSTPRPGYPHQMPDPYAQPPGTPRPHDPYAQMPGTPRPHSDPYPVAPSTPRTAAMNQFSQPNSRRQSPSHAIDPYAQMPGTPRPSPGERYPKSPGTPRTPDPYLQPPRTPQPVHNDPYSQAPVMSCPGAGPEAFSRLIPRGNVISHQIDPFGHQTDPFGHQTQSRMLDPFARPSAPGSQTPKHPGILLPQTNPNQTPVHDPFEQAPLTPCSQTGERMSHDVSGNTGNASDSQSIMQPPLGDAEEKIKQV